MIMFPPSFLVLFIAVFVVQVNTFFFKKLSKFRTEILTQTDQRVKVYNDIYVVL